MPLPRFVQRLFQNDGYGLKLRNEIIPWDDEKRFTALEAWRQAMIGTPMPMAGTTLPPGFMWADGSFASFAAYPELKAKYDAGGFTGMLLAYTASEEDIAAYPGKFKPNAANPTGLFVPRLNGLFARYCGGTGAGKRLGPGLPDILGTLPSENGAAGTSGAFAGGASGAQSYLGPGGTDSIAYQLSFKASRSSGIYGASTTVMPASVESPVALYLGRFAEV